MIPPNQKEIPLQPCKMEPATSSIFYTNVFLSRAKITEDPPRVPRKENRNE